MIRTIQIKLKEQTFTVRLDKPLDISFAIRKGVENPNCYWAEAVDFQTIVAGDFVGSVAQGGSVNYQQLHMTPHGNGTHTECFGHITDNPEATINRCLNRYHFVAELITVSPVLQENGDQVITLEIVQQALGSKQAEALIIRTLPNTEAKKTKQYSGTNPPYFEPKVMEYLVNKEVIHILTDLPSVDKEVDGGKLAAHKAFWQMSGKVRKNATITELIYVNNAIPDGSYLLNLQIISLEMDASPSKPVIYPLKKTTADIS